MHFHCTYLETWRLESPSSILMSPSECLLICQNSQNLLSNVEPLHRLLHCPRPLKEGESSICIIDRKQGHELAINLLKLNHTIFIRSFSC